nr:hypothetical protein [Desulfogranum mediterraneum]
MAEPLYEGSANSAGRPSPPRLPTILPQALKQMLPAIVGLFIAAVKDTSLAYIIGVMELTTAAYSINNRLMLYPFEIYTTIAVLYFICCYLLSRYANRLERRLSPERTRLAM